MTVEVLEIEEVVTDDSDEIAHIACCCSPRISLCGFNESDTDVLLEWQGDELVCAVCEDLELIRCPKCGYKLGDPTCFCGKCVLG
jgi:hypothetical protein